MREFVKLLVVVFHIALLPMCYGADNPGKSLISESSSQPKENRIRLENVYEKDLHRMALCAEASERAYDDLIDEKNNADLQPGFKKFLHYSCENTKTQTRSWINENEGTLIIAYRGTKINPHNFFADSGIAEGLLFESVCNKEVSIDCKIVDYISELINKTFYEFSNNDLKSLSTEEEFELRGMIGKKSTTPATMGIVSALYAGFYSWWWKEELDQDSLEKSIQKTLPIAREMAIKTFKAMGDHTIYIISSASARYNIQEVLLSGHSLGGNGVLSSIQRLKQETEQGKIKFNLNCIKGYMFNSPGGLLGCNVMANNLSEEDKAYIMDVLLGRKAAANDLSKKDRYSIPIYQIFRKSCIVGSNAKFTGFNINSIELSPYTKTEDKSFTHWCKTIVDEHSISILKKEIVEEYERCRQDRK